jgi:RNA polymerase sigma-70 factor (ECF subfamily)
MQNLSDEQVMLKYQNDEVEAMDELLARYKNPIYHYSLRLSRNAAEAQDIAQEVFLRVHQFKDDWRPIGKFSTWIFSIAHNVALSRLRKKKWLVFWPRKGDQPDELMDFESPDPSPQEVVSKVEVAELVKRCIQSLPFLQREALVLREYENLNYEEIGKILNKSQGTVKNLIHRARENLKNKLLPQIEEFGGGLHE